ncbi:MAG TPA: hypothetical protein VGL24_09880 [Chthoniobacterales bacterium]|jgi:hypothetical protein
MRTKSLLPLVVLVFITCLSAQAGPFGSWAARGLVVSKTFRPTPLSRSLGLDGIYRLELRGEDKKLRHQMVTREVFLAYEVGDQFDEHATPEAVKQARLAVAAKAQAEIEAARPKSPSLADVLNGNFETKGRLASENFPREMLPETEGF